MASDDRPDPDQLLKAISRKDGSQPEGRLRIFFGMSAGVGKTYAMLEAARTRKAEGIDVVAGLVETHGRTETAALLAGLEVIPRKKMAYRDVALEEMDLDAILQRKPQLVLVDELAHTDVPGSRHPKRWQDVVELLDAGIDVYTTLNVQHVDSRKATVESISGLTVRETVPDAMLERAAQIELVDITPADLLKRLSEGKVYLGDKAEAAANNFFKEDRLTALRELALRLTAEKVDSDLNDLLAARGGDSWKASERLMVAVSHSPHSENLIRATRRTAFSLNAPWIAVHVDTGVVLGPADQATLARNLQLVQELGGELVSTSDTDIAQAIVRVARQRRVTQLVVGKPTHRFWDFWSGGSLLDRLARSQIPCDILVQRPEGRALPVSPRSGLASAGPFPWSSYSLVIAIVPAVALLNYLALPFLGYKAAGFVFLLCMLLLSLVVPLGAVLLAAVLSALLWNYFFIPPLHTFYISDTEDIMMVLSYLVAAVVTGTLTHRIRTRQTLLRKREERTELLYGLAEKLVEHGEIAGAVRALAERVRSHLDGNLDVLVAGLDGSLPSTSALDSEWLQSEKERAVAIWSFDHRKRAGRFTDTLPMARALYLPLLGPSGSAVGVLALASTPGHHLSQDDDNLLSAIAHQLALYLERERLRKEVRQADKSRESERLLQAVMDSVSHELRTPLTAIIGSATALATDSVAENTGRRRALAEELRATSERLNRVVGNLLDMSRFSAGGVALQKDWHDVGDLLREAVASTAFELRDHPLSVHTESQLPLVKVDHRLMEQALANLLSNSALHTPSGTQVELSARLLDGQLRIAVTDKGPGFPESARPHLFTKFFRAQHTPPGGVGLGLAISKAIVDAHGGTVSASNLPGAGACVSIQLPVEAQPDVPGEEEEQ